MKKNFTLTIIVALCSVMFTSLSVSAGNNTGNILTREQALQYLVKYFGYNTTPETNGDYYEYTSSNGRTQTYTVTFTEVEGGAYNEGSNGIYTYVGAGNGTHNVLSASANQAQTIFLWTSYPAGYLLRSASGTTWSSSDTKLINANGPTEVGVGDVILVEINPAWEGAGTGSNYSTVLEQCMYGVKNVREVGAANKTPNGSIYGITAPLNSFFFAQRRSSYDTSNSSYHSLARWYNEWSNVSKTTVSYDDWAAQPHLGELENGDISFAPHNCFSTLEKNHYISLFGAKSQETLNITMLFYVQNDHALANKSDNVASDNRPFVFRYVPKQYTPEVTQSENLLNAAGQKVEVMFNSNFDKVSSQGSATMWTQGKEGVREYYTVYREIGGVREVIATNVIDQKKSSTAGVTNLDGSAASFESYESVQHIFDDNLPAPEGQSYEVRYIVRGELWAVDANGNQKANARGENAPIVSSETAVATVVIQGNEAFQLMLSGDKTSTYNASTTYQGGTNTFRNALSATTNLGNYRGVAANDQFIIYRSMGGEEVAVRTAVVTNVSESAITYTVDGVTYTASSVKNLVETFANFTDEINVAGGQAVNAYYQLVMRTEGQSDEVSNQKSFETYSVAATSTTMRHRQGHPDTNLEKKVETFHNEVAFTPIFDASVRRYMIYRNGVYTGKSVSYEETRQALEEGKQYTFVDIVDGDIVNLIEDPDAEVENVEFFYTVVVETTSNNTYGSADVKYDYTGSADELVFQVVPVVDNVTGSRVDLGCNPIQYSYRFVLDIKTNMLKFSDDVDIDHFESVTFYGITAGGETVELGTSTDFGSTITMSSNPIVVDRDTQKLKTTFSGQKYYENLLDEEAQAIYDSAPESVYAAVIYVDDEGNPVVKYTNRLSYNQQAGAGANVFTGIEGVENENANITVYPNPATDYVTVSGVYGEVSIVSAAGVKVVNEVVNGTATIDVTGLSKGLYIMQAGDKAQKILIK